MKVAIVVGEEFVEKLKDSNIEHQSFDTPTIEEVIEELEERIVFGAAGFAIGFNDDMSPDEIFNGVSKIATEDVINKVCDEVLTPEGIVEVIYEKVMDDSISHFVSEVIKSKY